MHAKLESKAKVKVFLHSDPHGPLSLQRRNSADISPWISPSNHPDKQFDPYESDSLIDQMYMSDNPNHPKVSDYKSITDQQQFFPASRLKKKIRSNRPTQSSLKRQHKNPNKLRKYKQAVPATNEYSIDNRQELIADSSNSLLVGSISGKKLPKRPKSSKPRVSSAVKRKQSHQKRPSSATLLHKNTYPPSAYGEAENPAVTCKEVLGDDNKTQCDPSVKLSIHTGIRQSEMPRSYYYTTFAQDTKKKTAGKSTRKANNNNKNHSIYQKHPDLKRVVTTKEEEKLEIEEDRAKGKQNIPTQLYNRLLYGNKPSQRNSAKVLKNNQQDVNYQMPVSTCSFKDYFHTYKSILQFESSGNILVGNRVVMHKPKPNQMSAIHADSENNKNEHDKNVDNYKTQENGNQYQPLSKTSKSPSYYYNQPSPFFSTKHPSNNNVTCFTSSSLAAYTPKSMLGRFTGPQGRCLSHDKCRLRKSIRPFEYFQNLSQKLVMGNGTKKNQKSQLLSNIYKTIQKGASANMTFTNRRHSSNSRVQDEGRFSQSYNQPQTNSTTANTRNTLHP